MNWVVIGSDGQLGTALCGLSPMEAGLTLIPLTHADLDLTDRNQLLPKLTQIQAQGVINTAAYNYVDLAEDHPEEAMRLNATGPEFLARACESLDIPLVQVSTDYVFGGDLERTVPYSEEDIPAPLSQYARSKLAGEDRVRENCSRHFIVRTCGVYGHARSVGKGNFVKTMLRIAGERPELKIVADQRCTPTPAVQLALGICRLIQTDSYGTYHLTSQGDCSWYEFAQEILRQAKIQTPVLPILTSDFGAKAIRPRYSVLNCDKLHHVTGFRASSWREGLADYLHNKNQPLV